MTSFVFLHIDSRYRVEKERLVRDLFKLMWNRIQNPLASLHGTSVKVS